MSRAGGRLAPVALAAIVSLVLHVWWHGGTLHGVRDQYVAGAPLRTMGGGSVAAGWCHVVYVAGELGLMLAWALSPAPPAVVWLVTIILSLHAPLGVPQPARGSPPAGC